MMEFAIGIILILTSLSALFFIAKEWDEIDIEVIILLIGWVLVFVIGDFLIVDARRESLINYYINHQEVQEII